MSATVERKRLEAVLAKRPADPSALIHLLQDIQAEWGYLPAEGIKRAAAHVGVPLSKAYSVATFYRAFSLTPRGRTTLRVCTGTACHIRGAQVLVDELRELLQVEPGQTTADQRFTLHTVNCVGACAMAPVVIAGEKYLANVLPGQLTEKMGNGELDED
jgi:NADH-quinone oxidoreductase subunit E